MSEVNHRAKNMLSVVQAIARQTAAYEPEDFIGCFTGRLQALAANHDLLVRNDWRGADLACFGLLRTRLSALNYHIAYLGLNVPLNDIAELSKTNPVLIAEKPHKLNCSIWSGLKPTVLSRSRR